MSSPSNWVNWPSSPHTITQMVGWQQYGKKLRSGHNPSQGTHSTQCRSREEHLGTQIDSASTSRRGCAQHDGRGRRPEETGRGIESRRRGLRQWACFRRSHIPESRRRGYGYGPPSRSDHLRDGRGGLRNRSSWLDRTSIRKLGDPAGCWNSGIV